MPRMRGGNTTPEEDLLSWLEREEEQLGYTRLEDALTDIDKARDLLFDELGYDMTEGQFAALKQASFTRYEELPTVSISFERIEQKWGFQTTYRDTITGRFVAREDVFSLLATIR